MLESELGSRKSWPDGLARRRLIAESSVERANRTRLSVVTQQSAANWTGPFALLKSRP
jgi:hypothetical protein